MSVQMAMLLMNYKAAMKKTISALELAERVESEHLLDLQGRGCPDDSAEVCASKLNLEAYREALALARKTVES